VIDWECTYQVGKRVIIPAEYANKILKIIYKLLKFKAMENESNKMTAVQRFIEQLEEKGVAYENVSFRKIQISIDVSDYLDLKRQAKQMEKQQHKNTWTDSRLRGDLYQNQIFYYESFNDYFKLEYGGKDGE
jgi:cysteinyl-tRNA synthetase